MVPNQDVTYFGNQTPRDSWHRMLYMLATHKTKMPSQVPRMCVKIDVPNRTTCDIIYNIIYVYTNYTYIVKCYI